MAKRRKGKRPPKPVFRLKPEKPAGFYSEASFGITPTGKTGTAVHSISDVLDEALRLTEKGTRHLRRLGLTPQPPKILHGMDKDELIDWHAEHQDQAAARVIGQEYLEHWEGHTIRMSLDPSRPTKLTRVPVEGPYSLLKKQPSNMPTLLSGVASYPGPPDDGDQAYVQWRALVVRWAKRRYGADLLSILEHQDEAKGHLHLLVARSDAGPVQRATVAAREAARARGEACNELDTFAAEGGRALQQAFYEAVGEPLGWVPPGTNGGYEHHDYDMQRLYQQFEDEVAAAHDVMDKRIGEARAATKEAKAAKAAATTEIGAMNAIQLAMHNAMRALQEREDKLKQEEAEAEARRAKNAAKAKALDDAQERLAVWFRARVQDGSMSRAEAREMLGGLRVALFPEAAAPGNVGPDLSGE